MATGLPAAAETALPELLSALAARGYHFVTPTPESHRRVVARPGWKEARDLRGIFGWSLPFAPDLLDAELRAIADSAGILAPDGGRLRSTVRVSTLDGRYFLHSAYPTESEDAVFFGPDTYRFVDFLRRNLGPAEPVRHLVDIGAGAGAGAIMAAPMIARARITMLDVNPAALRLAAINAAQAGVNADAVIGESLDAVTGPIDLIIANPPFIMDAKDRRYRDGGDMHGAALSRDWALAAAKRLEPGGRMLLYTGVAIVEGRDALKDALEAALPALGCTLDYAERDPDIFGEELSEPAYADVERIAAIGATIRKN